MMSSLFTTWLADQRTGTQAAASAPEVADVAATSAPVDSTDAATAGVDSGTATSDPGTAATGSDAGTQTSETRKTESSETDSTATTDPTVTTTDAPSTKKDATAAAKPARSTPEKVVLDAQLAAAIDVARSAIAEVAGSSVIGEHLGALAEGTRLVTHYFVCTDPSYRGWRWVAVLARAPRSKKVTVCETALLPGPDALVAPEWVPWDQRLEPGDLTPRDTLPKVDSDPNLQPGYQQTEDNSADNIDQIANFEFGIGRERVLSPEGISSAATRWANSDAGAEGEFSTRASAHCSTCGYFMPIAGSLREQFGVCANAWSPFDGRVVQLDSGCGAHSETDVRRPDTEPAEAVVDDYARGELELQEG